MTTTRKPRPSGPSGQSTPRALRTRRPLEITLSEEARAVLDGAAERTEETRSALVESLILSHLAGERLLPPALLQSAEELRTIRSRDGRREGLLDVLSEALAVGVGELRKF